MSDTAERLLPCPFCGGTEIGLYNNNPENMPGEDCWYVTHLCGWGGLGMDTRTNPPTKENAVAAWNRRASTESKESGARWSDPAPPAPTSETPETDAVELYNRKRIADDWSTQYDRLFKHARSLERRLQDALGLMAHSSELMKDYRRRLDDAGKHIGHLAGLLREAKVEIEDFKEAQRDLYEINAALVKRAEAAERGFGLEAKSSRGRKD